ncbi:MAG: hypothetical protein ACI3XI_06115 [Eubacteriales bacterium]
MNNNFDNYRGAFDKDLKMPAKQLPMGWYKFLVNFLLWANAAINLLSAVSYLNASAHTEEVYAQYPLLAPLDTVYGVLTVGMGVLALAAALSLRKYKKSGPVLAVALYAYGMAISLGYNIIGICILRATYEPVDYIITVMSVIVSASVSATLALCNLVYFKKRRHLFNK